MDYSTFTVAQLKAKLTERNLSVVGKKAELIKRLSDADELPKIDDGKPIIEERVEPVIASEVDLKKKRAERFGIPLTFEDQKKVRAKRFELNTNVQQIDEKILKRKERFGVISPILQSEEELQKKKIRAERFQGQNKL